MWMKESIPMLKQEIDPIDVEAMDPSSIPPYAPAIMAIDLGAVRYNYDKIKDFVGPSTRVAAVIKANAYGFGAIPTSQTLYSAGCRDFCVANINEALEVRPNLPMDARLYCMNGVQPGSSALLDQHNIIPTLLSPEQAAHHNLYALQQGKRLPVAIHVDTGLSREGMTADEIDDLLQGQSLSHLDVVLCLSHLSSADEPNNPHNDVQKNAFCTLADRFPQAERSFANSHGIARGQDFHFSMVRPGMALFGYCSSLNDLLGLKPALTVSARIVRNRHLSPGQTVGYNALFEAPKPMTIALINVGYADGIIRSLTNKGFVTIGGFKAPIVGKISMDFTTIDITTLPKHLTAPGSWVEIVHEAESFEALADTAGTCTYEITARLSQRFHRLYRHESYG